MSEFDINPRIIENEAGQIASSTSAYAGHDAQSNILDKQWVQNAFLIPDTGFTDETDIGNRYYSSADVKFTDTRLGCNIGINPRPQYCMYSDVPAKGRLSGRSDVTPGHTSGNYGMGRQYSEFIDDPAQRIYITFGVPQYNSLYQFLQAAYESEQMTLARTGRGSSLFYKAGQIAGSIALFTAFPLFSITILAAKGIRALFNRPVSKFYTLKPAMHLYWSSVNQLVNAMAINRGIFPKILDSEEGQRIGRPYKLDEEYLSLLADLMPDVFRNAGLAEHTFDMYAAASKAQRLSNKVIEEEYKEINAGTATDYEGYVKKTWSSKDGHATYLTDSEGNPTLASFLDHIASFRTWFKDDTTSADGIEIDPRVGVGDGVNQSVSDRATQEVDGFASYMDAMIRDGTLFATFIVDHTGAMSESWSNAVVESELSQKLNGMVNDVAEARFSFADGNIIGGIPGKIIGTAVSAATDVITGTLNGISAGLFDTLHGLAGGGYIDIPKHWQSSSFNATRANYTMQLISPYGNPISQLMNIDIPMAMLMAGALPRSTGKASYTAPFLCQIFDRGRCQIRLGMIESLSFSRGTSHLSYGDLGNALAVDVSFSVVDLSSIMHMPVFSGKLGDIDITTDEDNILADYMAVLAGMSIESQIYDFPRAKIFFAKKIAQLGKFTSPAYYASMFNQSTVANLLRNFTRPSSLLDIIGTNAADGT